MTAAIARMATAADRQRGMHDSCVRHMFVLLVRAPGHSLFIVLGMFSRGIGDQLIGT
jgi:hypothetical protein